MEKVNIVIGRFQPFTLGHLRCCTKAYKTLGLRTVLCIIDTIKPDAKHPFLTKMMWGGFKKLVKDYDEIADVILVKNADILKIGEAIAKKDYTVKTWSCGTDRYADYKKMCSKYAPDVEVIEIHREDTDISGTQVRSLIKNGDEEQFKELTPKAMHSLYSKFKDALEEI